MSFNQKCFVLGGWMGICISMTVNSLYKATKNAIKVYRSLK